MNHRKAASEGTEWPRRRRHAATTAPRACSGYHGWLCLDSTAVCKVLELEDDGGASECASGRREDWSSERA